MASEATDYVSQYLTFRLGQETFAVDVCQVREILDQAAITRVPQMPDYMLGVINLRGSVVPVVDLRRKFGMAASETTRESCIVVLEVDCGGETTVVGAQADAVSEVLDLPAEAIEPPPRLGMKLRTEFIRGMGKKEEQFLIILDIDKIFSTDELALLQESETV
jgi:purine-binding chemotaxis protein CheW